MLVFVGFVGFNLEFWVRDNGLGVFEDVIDIFFWVFIGVKYKGVGLGLVILWFIV